MVKGFTSVIDLYRWCKKEIDKGNGNKVIMISDDEEGNGYHYLIYEFTPAEEVLDEYTNSDFNEDIASKKNTIILG